MGSLRNRLIAAALVGVSLVTLLCGFPIFFLVQDRLVSAVDHSLEFEVRANVPAILGEIVGDERGSPPPERPLDGQQRRGGSRPFRGREEPDSNFPGESDEASAERRGPFRGAGRPPRPARMGPPRATIDDDLTFQCWNDAGEVVLGSPDLEGRELPRLGMGANVFNARTLDEGELRYQTITVPNSDAKARAAALQLEVRLPPQPGRPPRDRAHARYELVVTRDLAEVGATLRYLGFLLAGAWLLANLGAAGILTFIVRRGLRPLDSLRDQIANVNESKLEHVFEVPGAPSELRPVVDQMNSLVQRMRTSLEREQAFSANAAHEMRTPLAGLRATLEVAAGQAKSADEHVRAENKCLGIVAQMQDMVETLLQLARSEAKRTLRPRPIPVDALVTESWSRYEALSRSRNLRLERSLPAGLCVLSDRALLARMLDNLIENAITYADEGTAILVSGEVTERKSQIEVANDASSAPADLAERAGEAFWRSESARSATGQHAGLGLTLCRRIATALGGSLLLAYSDRRFTVRVELPGSNE